MMHRTDTYTASTPFGAVEVDFPEDGGSVFTGDAAAVDYLKSVICQQVGQGGISLTPENLEPIDFLNFCQPKGSGIVIIEPFDDLMMYGPTALNGDSQVLDSVNPMERAKLAAELASKTQDLATSKALSPIQRMKLTLEVTQLVARMKGDAPDYNMGRKWDSRDGEIEIVGYFNGDKTKYITTKAGKAFGAPIISASDLESHISLDKRLAESHARWQAEVAEKERAEREAKAAREAEYADIGGVPGESAMARARRVTALSALIRVDGAIKTKKRMVDDMVLAGATTSFSEENRIKPMSRSAFNRANNSEQYAHEKRIRDGGKVSVYQLGDSVVDKIAYDYANYLISKQISL